LALLQAPQMGRRFAGQFDPPAASGFTWSIALHGARHIQHRAP
jgi:hypothetical protein